MGTWRLHFGTFGTHFGGPGTYGDALGSTLGSRPALLSILGGFGTSLGTPFGSQIAQKSSKSRRKNHIEKYCAQSAAHDVPGDPPGLVSSTRNQHFQISNRIPKMINLNGFGCLFGGFLETLGTLFLIFKGPGDSLEM